MLKTKKVVLCVDKTNSEEIYSFLFKNDRHNKKFKFFCEVVVVNNNRQLKDIYKHEQIDELTKDVWAIRFFVGQENARIYCKEYKRNGIIYIVMTELVLRKKTNKIDKKLEKLIRKVGEYEHEIEE